MSSSDLSISAKFTSRKVSKVRWQPYHDLIFKEPDTFITGTWDDQVNNLTLWRNPQEDIGHYSEPVAQHSLPVATDVTDMQFVTNDKLVVAEASGDVSIVSVKDKLHRFSTWEKLHAHKFTPSPCTSLSALERQLITVGEDGKINLLFLDQREPLRTISEADSCVLTAVTFLTHSSALTGNSRGQMKVWDLRGDSKKPAQRFSVAEEAETGACSVARHPSQGHVVAIGSEDGTVTIWDMRKAEFPISALEGHTSSVREIKFHNNHPDFLFTCSEDGNVWQWDASRSSTSSFNPSASVTTPWLSAEVASNRLEVTALIPVLPLPVNSLDVSNTRLICGGDDEAIYCFYNLSF